MQEMAKGFSLLEEALLVFEAHDHKNQSWCYQCQAWVKFQLALHLLSLMILQLYYLPPLLLPAVSNFSCLFTDASPYMPAVVLDIWTLQGNVL